MNASSKHLLSQEVIDVDEWDALNSARDELNAINSTQDEWDRINCTQHDEYVVESGSRVERVYSPVESLIDDAGSVYEDDISNLIERMDSYEYIGAALSEGACSSEYGFEEEEDISTLIAVIEEEFLSSGTLKSSEILSKAKGYQSITSASSSTQTSSTLSIESKGKRKASEVDELESRPTKVSKLDRKHSHDGHHGAFNLDPNVPHIIAHSATLQDKMDEHKLPYGVQWEIGRLISLREIDYDNVESSDLSKLTGKNEKAAPKAEKLLKERATTSDGSYEAAFSEEIAARSPWAELDIEEGALAKNIYGGLGHNEDLPGWYGGKIEFRGSLLQVDKKEKSGNLKYKVVLKRSTLGPSSRFTRRFGSWSFISIKIPLEIFHRSNNGLDDFFKKPFVFWDHVFRACYAKDQNVFLFRTNERYLENGEILCSEGMSLQDFIQWHNPLDLNSNQLMAKWAARTALGFSNSVPGPIILEENVTDVPDYETITTTPISSMSSLPLPFKSDMTDGCGYSNKATLLKIYHELTSDCLPTGFQFRRGGCKGMCILVESDPHDAKLPEDAGTPWLGVRPSQTKIKYAKDKPLDPAHLIIDILRLPHLRTPARISAEIIINLNENGVPHSIFVELLKASVTEVIANLTTWDGPEGTLSLWRSVERTGGVLAARRARASAGEARFRGLKDRTRDEEEDEEGDDGVNSTTEERSTAWWSDRISGCPSSLEETVLSLLDSGFTPNNSSILREKLKQVVKSRIRQTTQNIRFEIQQSASAFVVPDPYNVLGPDEIQIRSSRRNLKMEDGEETDIIIGEVLITRNPCKVPSDVRKVKAVQHPLLRNHTDIIVCSIQGFRRLLDFLAGGDYDGDKVIVIWSRKIVDTFLNASDNHSLEPDDLESGFSRKKETGYEFLKRTEKMATSLKLHAMQDFLLGGLRNTSNVGKYSMMHDNAVFHFGYSDPRTVRAAYKFCKVLDGPKTGFEILPEVLRQDSLHYKVNTLGAHWKLKEGYKNERNLPELRRPRKLGEFIMTSLRDASKVEERERLAELDGIFSPLTNGFDAELARPWELAERKAAAKETDEDLRKLLQADLEMIKEHVENMHARHRQRITRDFTKRPIEYRQDTLRDISKEFASLPSLNNLKTFYDNTVVSRLRASYAYKYDYESRGRSSSRFPWDTSMRELCNIKCASSGGFKGVLEKFYDRFNLR